MSKFTTPACFPCSRLMVADSTGVPVGFRSGDEPFEVRRGDVWICPECGARVISGWAIEGIQAHEEGFSSAWAQVEVELS